MTKLRIGVAGCGRLARAAHLAILARNPRVDITGLADADGDALSAARRLAPTAAVFNTARNLIDSGHIDALVIATPSHLHASTACAAFNAGLHVYLEKPIASTLADGIELFETGLRSEVICAVGFNYRFNPLFVKLREKTQHIGQVSRISTTFRVPSPGAADWRARRETGGGAHLDLASHDVDLVRYILGDEVDVVTASLDSVSTYADRATVQMDLRGGAAGTVTAEFGGKFEHSCTVTGEKATLFVDLSSSVDVERLSQGRRTVVRHVPTPARMRHRVRKLTSAMMEPSFATALESFVDAVLDGGTASPDLADGLAALEVIDAAERSALSGAPVSVGTHRSDNREGVVFRA